MVKQCISRGTFQIAELHQQILSDFELYSVALQHCSLALRRAYQVMGVQYE